ncbi:acylphosphatase [Arthrobacter sp. R-11]|uniref:acylphosphatase n=1 Tax=Arthrobacter sp. R-11 TaxID=3404053 RepID=UPI003CEE5C08
MTEELVRLTATVTGRVQGVGFRYRTMAEARHLGLTGEAVNRWDGSVFVVAEGTPEGIEALLAWLRSNRAPGRVEHVEASLGRATGEFSGFGVE